MTNEEAIAVLQKIKPIPRRADSKSTTHILEAIALDIAIKALEQENVLDKIIDEVCDIADEIVLNPDSLYERKTYVRFGKVIEILNKYNAKSEVDE